MISSDGVNIRPGTPCDYEHFSKLAVASAPVLMNALLGPSAERLLQYLFFQGNNLFGYQNTYFLEYGAHVAGMVLAYDGSEKVKVEKRTQLLFLKYLKLGVFKVLPGLLEAQKTLGSFGKNERYISNLAVYEKYRSMGCGRLIMAHMDRVRLEKGNARLVLDVDHQNPRAIQFYTSIGYHQECEINLKIKNIPFTFLRMVKDERGQSYES